LRRPTIIPRRRRCCNERCAGRTGRVARSC
jgi:hypothetical protein